MVVLLIFHYYILYRLWNISHTEVTGFTPSSAIQIPLFYKNEILNPIPVFGRLSLKKPKPTKLTPNQSSQIVERHHSGQSLRELAADFGVSHETIRTFIKQHQADKSQYVSSEKSRKEMIDVWFKLKIEIHPTIKGWIFYYQDESCI